MNLDYETGRRVREFLEKFDGDHLTPAQVAFRFRLGDEHMTDIRDLMVETAILSRRRRHEPEVVTPPAEVLDILVAVVAEQSLADYRTGTCLRTCQMCRNRLLYMADTAPYSGNTAEKFRARLMVLPETHEAHGPAGPDQDPPRIRWISP